MAQGWQAGRQITYGMFESIENQPLVACVRESIESIPFAGTSLWIKTKCQKDNPPEDKCAKGNVHD
jgi:hypothetical protein